MASREIEGGECLVWSLGEDRMQAWTIHEITELAENLQRATCNLQLATYNIRTTGLDSLLVPLIKPER